MLASGAGSPGTTLAQQKFPPIGSDIRQTPTSTMIDPEFNKDKKLATWVDAVSGDIWVVPYDYRTGAFIPTSGRGVLIEAGVTTGGQYPGIGFTLNGPEWAHGTPTDYVVYTRTDAVGDPTPTNSQIGVAYAKPDGTWTRKSLSAPQRNGPYGSIGRNDKAKISYLDANGTHYARTLDDPESEVVLPGLVKVGLTPTARFVDMANVVVYQVEYAGVAQSVAYNIDTKVLTQLTFDPLPKDQSWMWSAPEFNGALGLMAIVNKTTIAMYAPVVDPHTGRTSYTIHGTAVAPEGGRWFSVEPFAYLGRTYMVAQYTRHGSSYPQSIWLAGFDPANPILRQLTPNGVKTEARADAEVLPTSTGVLIVYSKFDTTKCTPGNTSSWFCMKGLKGLFRADTGLAPPQ